MVRDGGAHIVRTTYFAKGLRRKHVLRIPMEKPSRYGCHPKEDRRRWLGSWGGPAPSARGAERGETGHEIQRYTVARGAKREILQVVGVAREIGLPRAQSRPSTVRVRIRAIWSWRTAEGEQITPRVVDPCRGGDTPRAAGSRQRLLRRAPRRLHRRRVDRPMHGAPRGGASPIVPTVCRERRALRSVPRLASPAGSRRLRTSVGPPSPGAQHPRSWTAWPATWSSLQSRPAWLRPGAPREEAPGRS